MSAKAIFVSAIRHLISVMCPPLVVIQLPRYLNFSTSVRTSPFSLISVFTFPSPFSTMMTVFFVFISIPNFLHFALVFSSRICRSSANRILVILWPPMLTPFSLSIALIITSEYKENRSGDATHPCLTPFFISTFSDFVLQTRIFAFCPK